MSGIAALGLVVARGGSKGLPRKNVLPLAGKPLIVHTVEAALAARRLDRVILSSDDPEIIDTARAAGCPAPFVRPAELAADRSSTVDVARHALAWLEANGGYRPALVVLLPATAPRRRAEHIDGAVEMLRADTSADAVVAVTEADYPPYWMLTLSGNRLSWLFPEEARADHRQELPTAYRPNGSIYAIRREVLEQRRTFYPPATAAYVMAREDSINVDAEMDLLLAEALMRPPTPAPSPPRP